MHSIGFQIGIVIVLFIKSKYISNLYGKSILTIYFPSPQSQFLRSAYEQTNKQMNKFVKSNFFSFHCAHFETLYGNDIP